MLSVHDVCEVLDEGLLIKLYIMYAKSVMKNFLLSCKQGLRRASAVDGAVYDVREDLQTWKDLLIGIHM